MLNFKEGTKSDRKFKMAEEDSVILSFFVDTEPDYTFACLSFIATREVYS